MGVFRPPQSGPSFQKNADFSPQRGIKITGLRQHLYQEVPPLATPLFRIRASVWCYFCSLPSHIHGDIVVSNFWVHHAILRDSVSPQASSEPPCHCTACCFCFPFFIWASTPNLAAAWFLFIALRHHASHLRSVFCGAHLGLLALSSTWFLSPTTSLAAFEMKYVICIVHEVAWASWRLSLSSS